MTSSSRDTFRPERPDCLIMLDANLNRRKQRYGCSSDRKTVRGCTVGLRLCVHYYWNLNVGIGVDRGYDIAMAADIGKSENARELECPILVNVDTAISSSINTMSHSRRTNSFENVRSHRNRTSEGRPWRAGIFSVPRTTHDRAAQRRKGASGTVISQARLDHSSKHDARQRSHYPLRDDRKRLDWEGVPSEKDRQDRHDHSLYCSRGGDTDPTI